MLTGREQETAFLENHYKRPGSQILVVYGQRGVGKTALLTAFTEEKQTLHYIAPNCSPREQRYQWGQELAAQGKILPEYPSWEEVFQCLTGEDGTKRVLILENFQYLLKSDISFLQELIRYLKEHRERSLLVILSTYASGWVENSMISKVGNLAFSVSGFLKVKELPFSAMRRIFRERSLQESIELYAALGGLPGLWKLLNPETSVEENLTALFLEKNSFLPELMIRWLSEELRETAVYNTILATIAEEKNGKLNDMYVRTGFSRAKISVYLKNLMELELVEKVLPGIYEISNSFIRFYFRFLFPHHNAWRKEDGRTFYEKYIRPDYGDFVKSAYRRSLQEILQTKFGKTTPQKVNQERICFLCETASGEKIAVDYSGTMCYTAEDYAALRAALKSIRTEPEEILIFSENGYESALAEKISGKVRFLTLDAEA